MPDSGVQNLGVELAGGVLSRPVSPKLAHEAVLAKPPYFDDSSCIRTVSRDCGREKGPSGKYETIKYLPDLPVFTVLPNTLCRTGVSRDCGKGKRCPK